MDDMLLIRELSRDTPLPQAAQLAPARDRLVNAMISDRPKSELPARRSRLARRFVIAGLATAGIATAVAALLTVVPLDKTSGEATQPSAAAGSAAAPDSTFRLVADTKESAQATARRLSEALDSALKKEAPAARWIFEPDYAGQSPGPDGQPPQLHVKALDGAKKSKEMFAGNSGVLQDGRKGSLSLQIIVDREKNLLSCSTGWAGCVEGTTPNGGKTVVITLSYPPLPGSDVPYRAYLVRVQLADGRVLSLEHWNDFGPDMTPAAQRDTPLTREQVTAIAIDIADKIKP